jgi:sulfite reductase alpha subunit-like flavoprotein
MSESASSSSSLPVICLFYGSQTGNSESIAHSLHSQLQSNSVLSSNCRILCYSMSDYLSSHNDSLSSLPSYRFTCYLLSTTGQGDPPDSAARFLRLLRKHLNDPKQFLQGVSYSVLALGDTNYTNFCAPGIRLDGELERLGGVRLLPRALADDAIGLQATVDPWKSNIEKVLENVFNSNSRDDSSTQPVSLSREQAKARLIKVIQDERFEEAFRLLQALINQTNDTSLQDNQTSSAVSNPTASKRIKVEKPPGLARLPVPKCVLHSLETSQNDPNAYFIQRWQHLKADEGVKGYSHEAPFMAKLIGARWLTSEKSHVNGRKVLHLEFQLPLKSSDAVIYEPGDSIGIYISNPMFLVDGICRRLNLNPHAQFRLDPPEDQSALNSPNNPLAHIHSPCTVQHALLYCCDITSTPRKTFFRLLAEHSTDRNEKVSLYHLASVGGAEKFEQEIVKERLTLLEILHKFPSSNPPLASLLSELPELKPRYYSVSCSPLLYPTSVQIAFTLVNYETPLHQHRQGIATSWLLKLAEESGLLESTTARVASIRRHQAIKALGIPLEFDPNNVSHQNLLDDSLRKVSGFLTQSFAREPIISNYKFIRDFFVSKRSSLSWNNEQQLLEAFSKEVGWPNLRANEPLLGVRRNQSGDNLFPVFIKRSKQFTLPVELKLPCILIGPGTGVAPFRGFLQHRQMELTSIKAGDHSALGWWRGVEMQLEEIKQNAPPSRALQPLVQSYLGQIWLFFGCRSRDEDYLYREDFQRFHHEGVLTQLVEAFSREQEQKIYVQHKIRQHSKEIADLIIKQNAVIYVCGDGANMARQVAEEIEKTLELSGMSQVEAKQAFFELIKHKRFIQDIWS